MSINYSQPHRYFYEYQHSLRVARLCEIVCKTGWVPCDAGLLVKAAELHDIGKFRIDSDLLELPRTLTPSEMNVIKKHPLHSYDWVLTNIGCRDIARIVVQHHEASDGSGYPKGITDISIEAIVIRICDIFDALTSDRPYRAAFTREKALEIMRKELRGDQERKIFAKTFPAIFSFID